MINDILENVTLEDYEEAYNHVYHDKVIGNTFEHYESTLMSLLYQKYGTRDNVILLTSKPVVNGFFDQCLSRENNT